MSQEELAEKIEVSRQAISRWETGTTLPDANNILALSKLYSVTADYLLLASIWMSNNHRYESDKLQRAKNTKVEMYYCICQAAIAVIGYVNHWTLLTSALILTIMFFYIFVVNPKYMNRKLVHKKK